MSSAYSPAPWSAVMRMLVTFAVAAILVDGGAVTLAAPQQYPGQMTQAHVWVQNRGATEAVPVDLRDDNLARPLRVTVMNEGAASSASNPVPVKPVRRTWEYKTLLLGRPDDAARALAPSGGDGWEATGVAWPSGDGTLLLLKRSR